MKYISLIFIFFVFSLINANFYENDDLVNTSPIDFFKSAFYVSMNKNFISYDFEMLYTSEKNNSAMSIGLIYDFYDNIEITLLSDSNEEINYDNIPYIDKTINLYSISIPMILCKKSGNINMAITNIISYTDLYLSSSITNNINIGFEYLINNCSYKITAYNLIGEILYSESELNHTFSPMIEIIGSREIYNWNNTKVSLGLKIEASYLSEKKYNFIYSKYGFNRNFLLNINYKNINCGLELFGPYVKGFLKYFYKEKYNVSIGLYKENDINNIKILMVMLL